MKIKIVLLVFLSLVLTSCFNKELANENIPKTIMDKEINNEVLENGKDWVNIEESNIWWEKLEEISTAETVEDNEIIKDKLKEITKDKNIENINLEELNTQTNKQIEEILNELNIEAILWGK